MTSESPSEPIDVRIIRDAAAWDALRPEWIRLHRSNPRAAAPLDFEWVRGWWDVYGGIYGRRGLRIITARHGGELVGVLPVYLGDRRIGPISVRTLRFLSTGETSAEEVCPEFMDLLCRPGLDADVARRTWDAIWALRWDALELMDMAADTPLVPTAYPGTTRESRGTSYVADLTGGLSAYVERLSSSNRAHLRRLLRQGERINARLDVADAATCGEAFDDLVRLHQARWTHDGQPGVFAAPRFDAFHRRLVSTWIPDGRAVIARLFVGNDVYAAHYGFLAGRTFHLYQSGVQMAENDAVHSPGILAILLLMDWLAHRGVTTFDFLRGPATHKERMATSRPEMISIRAYRSTPRGLLLQAMARAREWHRTAEGAASAHV